MNQNDGITALTKKAKADSYTMAALPLEVRNRSLIEIANALSANRGRILEANLLDMEKAKEEGLSDPMIKRLKFDEAKLRETIDGIHSLIDLPDPLFRVLLKRELDQGLVLEQVTCPIGVIGVIFESRPDALVQIATLCLKSGNCAILKGGSEAANTNRALFEMIRESAIAVGVPMNSLLLVENRADIDALLKCDEDIDLLIPRGSNAFVQYIMEHSKIPVMGHSDGVCHLYVDKKFDLEKAVRIILDSKTQYVAACNTLETLLIHEEIADQLLPTLHKALEEKHVAIKGSPKVQGVISCEPAEPSDWEKEYLDYILSMKTVASLDEAITHINHYGSHHTDGIITEDPVAAEQFMLLVDSAGVYQNCSTRFADGYRYGFGAEVGISTGKLHARGPVGLEGLVTYKYKLHGLGHIVGDYASGAKQFHFRDLESL